MCHSEYNPNQKTVEYFTDRCAAQYKNCKSFCTLSTFKADFGSLVIICKKSHKSPCNGIDGNVKLSAVLESRLQWKISNYSLC